MFPSSSRTLSPFSKSGGTPGVGRNSDDNSFGFWRIIATCYLVANKDLPISTSTKSMLWSHTMRISEAILLDLRPKDRGQSNSQDFIQHVASAPSINLWLNLPKVRLQVDHLSGYHGPGFSGTSFRPKGPTNNRISRTM
jgi:hypothetical protein